MDPHKRTHTASVVEPGSAAVLATMQAETSLPGYRRLLWWAAGFGEQRWAVENARGLGGHLAQWLLARGEIVEDVPSTATARVRELSCGGRRKTDVIDAAAAASVAALRGDANQVARDDLATVLGLLDERRANVVSQRTRLVNQLHALLRDLLPGGAPAGLTAAAASRLLVTIRPAARAHPPRQQVPHLRRVRQLRRRGPHRSRQRRPRMAPAAARRRPPAQPRPAHHHLDPRPHRPRHPRLPHPAHRREQDNPRSQAMPQTDHRPPALPAPPAPA